MDPQPTVFASCAVMLIYMHVSTELLSISTPSQSFSLYWAICLSLLERPSRCRVKQMFAQHTIMMTAQISY